MVSSDEDRARRAELGKELGCFPATLNPIDIERLRRLNAALGAAATKDRIAAKYAHLHQERRRTEVEERGRREVAHLHNEADDDDR
jgi:hypothetical protein